VDKVVVEVDKVVVEVDKVVVEVDKVAVEVAKVATVVAKVDTVEDAAGEDQRVVAASNHRHPADINMIVQNFVQQYFY